jgi:hypothetical protein
MEELRKTEATLARPDGAIFPVLAVNADFRKIGRHGPLRISKDGAAGMSWEISDA